MAVVEFKEKKDGFPSKAEESEATEKDIARTVDDLSRLVGVSLFIEGRYEDWKSDDRGNRIRFSRYYPGKKLYIDIFQGVVSDALINEREGLVKAHGGFYLPIKQGQTVKKDDILKCLKTEVKNGKSE